MTTTCRGYPHKTQMGQKIEKKVLETVSMTDQYQRIQQVPGIGVVLGMFIVLESGDFERFASAGRFASYCRTVKSSRTSNNKSKGKNNAKNGNKFLSWAFIEAALLRQGAILR